MKIEKEFRDDHQVKLTVEMDSEPFESAKRRAARQIAKRIKIPGFRPGKAPYGVVLRQVGEGHIVEQALEILVDEQYPEIIKEAEIKPYGPGTLENVPELDPPTFEFIIPLDSVVELGDYKATRIPFELPTISDKQVEESLKQIQEQNAIRESVDRPAEIGDIVFMRVSGVNTAIEDGEDATIVEERFSTSIIREDEEDNEWPFPGFSKELIGISTEEEATIYYQYPDDFEDESLQGVNAEFKVVVTNIQSQSLPEIDDELAKTASDFDTLDEWRADQKLNMEENSQQAYADEYDNQVLDHIISESTLKYPPQMLENEKKDILRGLEYRLSQQGINKDLYLQIRGIDEDELNNEITPVAEQRIKRALVLMEIAKLEGIQTDPEKVQDEMGRTMQAISSTMTPNDAKKFAKSDYLPSLASNIVADMLTQRTIEYLRATAKGEKWPVETETVESEVKDEQLAKEAEGKPDEDEGKTTLPGVEDNEVEGTQDVPEEEAETAPSSQTGDEVESSSADHQGENPIESKKPGNMEET